MKRKIALITLSLGLTLLVNAAEVTPSKAAAVAKQMMMQKVDGFDDEVKDVKTVGYEGKASYYVVSFRKGGWALISADDLSKPLLGYSTKGTFDTEEQPENMKYMLDIYSRQIRNNARLGGSRHAEWEQASLPTGSDARRAPRRAATVVLPLIEVNWNQTGAYATYVKEHTEDGVPVGCVAVGMAQAMSVAQDPSKHVNKRPVRPQGYHAYDSDYGSLFVDYDNEAAYDWNAILSGANNKKEVARLLWHCGVAVNMNYAPGGSGAHESAIPGALQKYFDYPKAVTVLYRANYKNEEWKQLIVKELKEGRAVIYCGADPVKNYGHCFNIDGYDGDHFHVNWGWGGVGQDIYFSLDDLHDGRMNMDYTSGQSAVINVRPKYKNPSFTLTNKNVAFNQPAGTVVSDVNVESEIENCTFSFKVTTETVFSHGKRIPAPFEVIKYAENNYKLVTTEVFTKEEYVDPDYPIYITVTNDQNGGTYTNDKPISITFTDASGIIDVKEADMITDKSYYTAAGAQLNEMQQGINIVRRKMADGSVSTIKVIK